MQNFSTGSALASSQQLPSSLSRLLHHHHHLHCSVTKHIHDHPKPRQSMVPSYLVKKGVCRGNAHIASASASYGSSRDGAGFDPRVPASENGFVKRYVMRAHALASIDWHAQGKKEAVSLQMLKSVSRRGAQWIRACICVFVTMFRSEAV